MQKTKPMQIDAQSWETPVTAAVADVEPWNVQAMPTAQGALVTRERFARVPAPEGFDTNLTQINKGC
jgi:hypothetical protein